MTSGGQGWADVWYKGNFAWEYKGNKADLRAAYCQLRQYVADLETMDIEPGVLPYGDLDFSPRVRRR